MILYTLSILSSTNKPQYHTPHWPALYTVLLWSHLEFFFATKDIEAKTAISLPHSVFE